MRKVSKALAVLLSVCMLFSVAMSASAAVNIDPTLSSNYSRPDRQIRKITSDITIDGKLEDTWKNEATYIEFTKEALSAGSGLLWSYTQDDLIFDPMPEDGDGDAYIGWTEQYFYFALQIKDAVNDNDQMTNLDLWRGDCLQMQIAADTVGMTDADEAPGTAQRYEFGFAKSSAGRKPVLGYKWRPIEEEISTMDGIDYSVTVENGTTTYEVRLRYDVFGRTGEMSQGEVIPFSFSLHLNKEVNVLDETDNGWFMEWARGTVGGDTLGTGEDPYSGIKNIGSAARLTLGGPNDDVVDPIIPPTPDDGDDDEGTTTEPPATTTAPPADNNDQGGDNATTTVAPTTTTTAPDILGVDVFYDETKTSDEDNADELKKIEDQLTADKIEIAADHTIAVKKFVPNAAKFGISADGLLGIYVKDADGNYKLLTDKTEEDVNGSKWEVYNVADLKEGDAVYVVKDVAPTTTAATTTTVKKTTTTTSDKDGADVTTAPEDNGSEGGSWWIWLIVVVAVLAVAGVVVFFLMKKKNNEDEDETPSEE